MFLTQKFPQMTVFYPKLRHLKKTTLYVPDSSSRTEKMLYASCMGSLKSSFNSGRISHTFTINDYSDMKWSYFRKQYFEINKEELMSVREKALAESRVGEEESRREAIQAQANLVQRLNTQNTGGGGGVTFPFSDEAKQAINDYLDDSINYSAFEKKPRLSMRFSRDGAAESF